MTIITVEAINTRTGKTIAKAISPAKNQMINGVSFKRLVELAISQNDVMDTDNGTRYEVKSYGVKYYIYC